MIEQVQDQQEAPPITLVSLIEICRRREALQILDSSSTDPPSTVELVAEASATGLLMVVTATVLTVVVVRRAAYRMRIAQMPTMSEMTTAPPTMATTMVSELSVDEELDER